MNRTLKSLALLAAVGMAAVMSGCAQIEAKVSSDVQPILQNDLSAAIAVAKERPTTEQQPLACYTGLQTWVSSFPTTAPGFIDPGQAQGLISGLEVARIGVLDASTPAPALPPLDTATYNACLVAFADTKIAAIKLAGVVAGLAKGAGIAQQAASLKAEAAALRAVGKP
jgi:hypothetical protein